MSKKLQLVLDLDETLINNVPRPVWQALSEIEQNKYKVVSDSVGDSVFVIRPHVKELLDFGFENSVVSIWTWAGKDYAHEVANLLTGGNPQKFANIWSEKDSNDAFEIFNRGKDLNHLWLHLSDGAMLPCNTILVDDLETNTKHVANKNNSIQVPAFELFAEKSGKYNDLSDDKALLNVIDLLKDVIADERFCATVDTSPFTSFHKVSSAHIGGQRKRPSLKRKLRKGTKGSRARSYKS
jgi:hypothetical protein